MDTWHPETCQLWQTLSANTTKACCALQRAKKLRRQPRLLWHDGAAPTPRHGHVEGLTPATAETSSGELVSTTSSPFSTAGAQTANLFFSAASGKFFLPSQCVQ